MDGSIYLSKYLISKVQKSKEFFLIEFTIGFDGFANFYLPDLLLSHPLKKIRYNKNNNNMKYSTKISYLFSISIYRLTHTLCLTLYYFNIYIHSICLYFCFHIYVCVLKFISQLFSLWLNISTFTSFSLSLSHTLSLSFLLLVHAWFTIWSNVIYLTWKACHAPLKYCLHTSNTILVGRLKSARRLDQMIIKNDVNFCL